MRAGYIKLHRGWRDSDIFKGEFSRADAWVWLIENACWKPSRARIKGSTVELARGELTFSVRFLADKWGWSKSRVDRFIADLRSETMIETRSKIGTTSGHKAGQGQSILTVCNYAKYQDEPTKVWDNDNTETGTKSGQQRDKEEEGKKERRNNISAVELPEWLPSDEWAAFVQMRKEIKKPLTGPAVKIALTKLVSLKAQGHNPVDVLNQSTMSSWQGLFEVKNVKAQSAEIAVGI